MNEFVNLYPDVVTHPNKSNTSGEVYFISDGEAIKIGWAANTIARYAQVATGLIAGTASPFDALSLEETAARHGAGPRCANGC